MNFPGGGVGKEIAGVTDKVEAEMSAVEKAIMAEVDKLRADIVNYVLDLEKKAKLAVLVVGGAAALGVALSLVALLRGGAPSAHKQGRPL